MLDRPTVFSWTDDNVQQLRTMWERGDNGRIIAKALGTSRNAVLGKVHRMGFDALRAPAKEAAKLAADERIKKRLEKRRLQQREAYLSTTGEDLLQRREDRQRQAQEKALAKKLNDLRRQNFIYALAAESNVEAHAAEERVLNVKPNPVDIPEPESLNLSLIDLERGQCRWVTTNNLPHTFCGHETQEGSQYCPHHHKRVYNGLVRVNRQTKRVLKARIKTNF